jgi:thiol-disulfide isomerase/thioredoxin
LGNGFRRFDKEAAMRSLRILVFSLLCVMGMGKVCADTVLMFSADWCKYCKIAKADLLENKDEVNGWGLEVVDTDVSRELVKQYGVKSLPTFIYLNDAGEELDRVAGYKGYNRLRRWVEKSAR